MKYLIYLFVIVLLLGLNLGLFNNLQIRSQIPNLLFLLVLCFALGKKDYDCFFLAFACGLFLDVFSTGFFGGFTLAFLFLCLCLQLFVNNLLVFELNWKTVSLGFIFSFAFLNLFLWLYGLTAFKLGLATDYNGSKDFLGAFTPGLIYNWLFLYPLYAATDFLKRVVENLNIRSRGVVR